jgi:trimethylamine--corrinoid protein Co-methyltransferase
MLSADEVNSIHRGSLRILERIGMLVEHAGARELLAEAGASVSHESNVVRFPSDLVEAKINLIPRSLEYHGRTPEFSFTCEPDGDVYSEVGGGSTGYIDLTNGQYRRARLDDLKAFSILGDALPNIHVAAAHMCIDVPAATSDLHCLRVLLESQRLPISTSAFGLDNLRCMIEMLLAVQGSRQELASRPRMHLEMSPISPLYLAEDDAAQLLLACEYHIPILFAPMPNAGATGPITLVGTVVQAIAEWLAMATLTQCACPGLSVPFFVDPVVADMRTVSAQFASPEAGFLMTAIAQVGNELYGFPNVANGLCTDGFSYPQTLFQKAQNALFHCLAGGRLMLGAGETESVTAFDPVQLVIDDEIMAIVRRWARRMVVNDDSIAFEVLERVGPRGHFLGDEHTLDHLHAGELFNPELFERGSRTMWMAGGAKTVVEAARAKAENILASHEVPPLPDEVSRELRAIVARADERLA